MFQIVSAIQINQSFRFFNYLEMMLDAKEQQHGFPQYKVQIMAKFINFLARTGINAIDQRAPLSDDPLVDNAFILAQQVVAYYYEGGKRPDNWEQMGPWFQLGQPLEHQ